MIWTLHTSWAETFDMTLGTVADPEKTVDELRSTRSPVAVFTWSESFKSSMSLSADLEVPMENDRLWYFWWLTTNRSGIRIKLLREQYTLLLLYYMQYFAPHFMKRDYQTLSGKNGLLSCNSFEIQSTWEDHECIGTVLYSFFLSALRLILIL